MGSAGCACERERLNFSPCHLMENFTSIDAFAKAKAKAQELEGFLYAHDEKLQLAVTTQDMVTAITNHLQKHQTGGWSTAS